MRGEPGSINGDVVAGVAFEPPYDVGIELALDPRAHAARLGESSGVNDLLGRMGQVERFASQVRSSVRIRLWPMYVAIVAMTAPKNQTGLTSGSGTSSTR